jgi:hypothetical protein
MANQSAGSRSSGRTARSCGASTATSSAGSSTCRRPR